jgi:crotonobetainyl-CoA:carnitine CoA-transferase CaiB-like acyl-CoA transferase
MRSSGAELGILADIDWASFDSTQATQDDVDAMEVPIGEFFMSITKMEFLQGAFEREMLGYPVNNVADISQDPQLKARGFWAELPAPDGGTEFHCGGLAIVDGKRLPLDHPVPGPGQHSREVLTEFGLSANEIDNLIADNVVADK